jgi:hypothetical protein
MESISKEPEDVISLELWIINNYLTFIVNMKTLTFGSHVLLSFTSISFAYPGMGDTIQEMKRAAKVPRADTPVLIGDLRTLKDSQLTSIGKGIKAILLSEISAESSDIDTSIPVGNIDTAACKADLCCIWKWIAYEMTAKFNGTSGRCTKFARQAVRLGFHDAGVWSNTSSYGGADGSILLTDEINRSDNNGLASIASQMMTWYNKYNKYGVSMADLIQFGANVATVVCPLGPRIRSFVGRKDNAKAGPTGLLPDVNDSADKLIKMFEAKTITPNDLVALVGAHTTPGVWDVAFYGETLNNPPPRVIKFKSDIALSKDSRTKDEWNAFVTGQGHWNAVCSSSSEI